MTTVKISQGDAIFCRRNGLLAVKFHDKRDVKMMSTIHSADAVRVVRHDRSVVTKPTSIADYTRLMGGVDLLISWASTFIRRTVKWWKKLFFHLLNLLVVNASMLFNNNNNTGNLLHAISPKSKEHIACYKQITDTLLRNSVTVTEH